MRGEAHPLLLALLLAALPAAAQERPQSPPPTPRTSGALKVLSYNVHGLPPFVTGNDTLKRQSAISPLLEPFDVVGLQEDFMDPGHARLMRHVSHPVRFRFQEALLSL